MPSRRRVEVYTFPENAEVVISKIKTAAKTAAMSALVLSSLLITMPVLAENELSAMANGEFKPDLVSSECFATSCKLPTKKCVEDADCKKGLMCTARCLGDSACITGCFARFGNDILNDLLQCSIEDYKCINIAIIPPGSQPSEEVPMPPKALAASFKPSSMDGEWYKVLGWNRQYDCFDCQKNTFQVDPPSAESTTASMDVAFSMVAKRSGREETASSQHMRENMQFDAPTFVGASGDLMKSRRTAHTEGRMFGLTFWENWYILGENKPSEPPFKFVYYTGKTLQNTYSGAFVYSRTPELPPEVMPSVYKIAREAGMNPDKFCRIRNACFARDEAKIDPTLVVASSPSSIVLQVGDETGIENPSLRGDKENPQRFTTSIEVPLQTRAKALWYDVLDYIEDPHEAARWMFDQQQQMVWPFKASESESVTTMLTSSEST